MKRLLALALLIAAPAFAGDESDTIAVKFKNGLNYKFAPVELLPNGSVMFTVVQDDNQVEVEQFIEGKVANNPTIGQLACRDLFYVSETDLVHCASGNGYRGAYLQKYRGEKGQLVLMKTERLDLDDDTTPENEEKTTVEYERK